MNITVNPKSLFCFKVNKTPLKMIASIYFNSNIFNSGANILLLIQ